MKIEDIRLKVDLADVKMLTGKPSVMDCRRCGWVRRPGIYKSKDPVWICSNCHTIAHREEGEEREALKTYTKPLVLFEGHHSLSAVAVVQAENEKEAAAKLQELLKKRGFREDIRACDMVELVGEVVILLDGNS